MTGMAPIREGSWPRLIVGVRGTADEMSRSMAAVKRSDVTRRSSWAAGQPAE